MVNVFRDAKGILLIDYLEKGSTIIGEFYSNNLAQQDVKIREEHGLRNISTFITTTHLLTSVLAMGKVCNFK